MVALRNPLFVIAVTALVATWNFGFAQPSARGYVEMAYDSESEVIVLFGGATGHIADDREPISGETWILDPASGDWEQRFPDPSPPPLFAANLAYDSESDRIVLWSGDAGYADRESSLWSYDANSNTWELHEVASAEFPQSRYGARMAYHPGIDRTILFGGVIGPPTEYLNDTWALDLNAATWTQLHPADPPNRRNEHHLTYDASTDNILLWAGDVVPQVMDESVWRYDPQENTWSERVLEGASPQARALAGMVGIPGGGVLVYSGREDSGEETWIYNAERNEWRHVDASGPGTRYAFALASAGEYGIFMFGGDEGPKRFKYLGDTWRFDLDTLTWERP